MFVFQQKARPTSRNTFKRFRPAFDPAHRIDRFDTTGAYRASSRKSCSRRHATHQAKQKPSDRSITSAGCTHNGRRKARCPKLTLGPGTYVSRLSTSHMLQLLSSTRTEI